MNNNFIHTASTIISNIFSPLLSIIYLLLILFFSNTYLNMPDVTLRLRLLIIVYVALTTIVLPSALIYILKMCRDLYYIEFLERYNLNIKLTLVALCYTIAFFMLSPLLGVYISLKIFMLSAIILTASALMLIFYPHISLHMIGLSTIEVILWNMTIIEYGKLMTESLIVIAIMGVVASAQLYLQKTSLKNIFCTILLTTLVSSMVLYL